MKLCDKLLLIRGTLVIEGLRRVIMPGDLIVENLSMGSFEYPAGLLDVPQSWHGSQFAAAATLLQNRAAAANSPARGEASFARNGSEWEKISLAIHGLRTNCLQYRLLKRFLDILLLCALLPCLLPLFFAVAVIVKLSSPGPILYRQKRIGRFGREFGLWKFRSMFVNGDEILRDHLKANPEAKREWAESHKLKVDPRVTRVGKVIRRASLDEIPQFINVLLGHMSLVGPRPIVSAERVKYRDAYFFYASAKPGLSGLWQVSGRSDLSYGQRVALDEEYVRTWKMTLDLKILWRTAGAVWGSKGAV
jgi:lipopolysaccharide/colanic/teichoic acid biosynthesis glycosyltransferase